MIPNFKNGYFFILGFYERKKAHQWQNLGSKPESSD